MLKLGCVIPKLAHICSHSSTSASFYPFIESDKNLPTKVPKDIVGGPSIVLARKAAVDETHIRKSTIVCKLTVGENVSQIYPCSMWQPMPTAL